VSRSGGTRTGTAEARLPRLPGGLVRIIDGADRGRAVTLGKGGLVVGTSDACDLVLHDARVSRRHVQIALGPYGFLVNDLGSRNGTFFEGSRVAEIAVPPGAILRLGKTHLGLFAASDAATLEPSPRQSFGVLVGQSLPMRRIFTLLERAAASDVTVLLGGETGTGKELAARAIHDESGRRGKPFRVFDCGAVAPSLIATELFGHRKGAYSGAVRDRIGLFEVAEGGTVFLDEIGELPLELQPALLRVCDTGKFTRVGDDAPVAVDVRVIAATRRDLAEEVLAGRFREDLYYRLQVLPITIPPLRARREDLPALIGAILREHGIREPGPIGGAPLGQLLQHPWPGNVRELRNTLQRALVTGAKKFGDLKIEIDAAVPPPQVLTSDSFQDQKRDVIERFERDFLRRLMDEHAGNLRRASRASGIERTQLRRLLKKHELL
jgi:transcriptional regulator with GAF, ATPase, and Fis domain